MQKELKDEPQLMRIAVAERKRDLKNSVELQVQYDSRKLFCFCVQPDQQHGYYSVTFCLTASHVFQLPNPQ